MANVMDMKIPGKGSIKKEQYETVHCLLLPLNKEIALLPNASVAEIIPFTEPESPGDAPEWLVGKLNWRDRRIPLVMFESASDGEAGKIHKNCRIAVLNTLNGNSQLPYIGIVTQGLPSLQIVRQNNIQFSDNPATSRQAVKAYINLNGTAAIVPDIDELEARLTRLHT